MYLTPENAPVGAVVVIRLRGHVKLVEISEWNGEKVWIRWEGEFFGAEVGFVLRLDKPKAIAPSGLGCVDRDRIYKVAIERSRNQKGDAPPNPTTPGDSVTIERDRAAIDALRRLAAKAMGISVVSDDVNVESLEAVVRARLGCIERELSALRELRRALERLPGEGDVVEWGRYKYAHPTPTEWADTTRVWCLDGWRTSYRLLDVDAPTTYRSVSSVPPHPDLHPVRVDGVWRWQRK